MTATPCLQVKKGRNEGILILIIFILSIIIIIILR